MHENYICALNVCYGVEKDYLYDMSDAADSNHELCIFCLFQTPFFLTPDGLLQSNLPAEHIRYLQSAFLVENAIRLSISFDALLVYAALINSFGLV